ncbi:hypothetical protein KCU79_g5378, partial [Aureobasidium melanogenum]
MMRQQSEDREKTFECRTCDRSFARLEHLQRHLRTHTKERPYACFCGQTFTRQDLLKRHYRRAHEAHSRLARKTLQNANEPLQSIVPGDHVLETGNIQENETFPAIPSTQLHAVEASDQAVLMEQHLDLFDHSDVNLDWLGDAHDLNLEWNNTPLGGARDLAGNRVSLSLPSNADGSNLEVSAVTSTRDASNMWWDMTKTQLDDYENLRTAIYRYLPDYQAPSYHSLRRYIDSYVRGFDRALPFIHNPMMCLKSCSAEVVLGMAAIGARELSEPQISLDLFQASKMIALDDLRTWKTHNTEQETPLASHAVPQVDDCNNRMSDAENKSTRYAAMESLRALLLVSFYGLWGDASLLKDVVDLQSLMIEVAQSHELIERPEQSSATMTWQAWILEERDRRTKFALFCFLNLQTVMNDTPSPVLCSEWQLRLPCPAEIWEAQNEQEWMVKLTMSEPVLFQDIFRALLSSTESDVTLETKFTKALSQFDCTIIILALLQRIYYLRQLCDATGETLRQEEIQRLW